MKTSRDSCQPNQCPPMAQAGTGVTHRRIDIHATTQTVKLWARIVIALLVPVALWITFDSSLGLERFFSVAILSIFIFFAIPAVRGSAWIVGSRLTVRQWRTRTVDLAQVTKLDIVGNNGGGVLLRASDGGPTCLLMLFSALNTAHNRSRDILLVLADAVGNAELPSAKSVAAELRAQAAFMETHGPPEQSPMNAKAGTKVLDLALGAAMLGFFTKL